jgi:methionyl-tRNA synthetase
MMEAMQTSDDTWPSDVAAALSHLSAGHAFSVPEVLFAKITDEQREEWQARFAGTRD